MIFAIAKFIGALTGWDISKIQRWIAIAIVALIGLVILSLGLWAKSCWTAHKLKVSDQQMEKLNKANVAEQKKVLQDIVADNTDAINTVDNRTALSETNVVERNRLIDERVADAEKRIAEAKAQGRDVTGEELECILIPENCKK